MPHRVGPSRPPDLAQIRAHAYVSRLRTDKFSPTVMGTSWSIFLLLHLVCLLYFFSFAWCYWNLPNTRLDRWLAMLYLGMGTEYHRIIAGVHVGVAIVHAAYIVWMIGWSYRKKSFIFAMYNVITWPAKLNGVGDEWPLVAPLKGGAFWVYKTVFTRDGLLGVDGPNFDLVLLSREIVETALQTQQAYRMSLLLPRTELNRGYVALLVLNCWSTALVHSVFHGNPARRRFLALVCDCMLDLVSSIGIPTVLVAIYILDFDFKTYGFPFLKWYEDVWRVHAMSEFQMILVSSWGDLAMRFIFAMSMLGNLNNMKKLIRARPMKPVKVGETDRHRVTAVAPFHATFTKLKKVVSTFDGVSSNQVHYWVGKVTEIGFFVWGLVVLVLHLHAEATPELPQCTMQVKPWSTNQPSCSLLELNCDEGGISGKKTEVAPLWSEFDPSTVFRVVIRHCPQLELPEKLAEFSDLKELKIYNSTVTEWSENSALTQTSHSKLTTLFLIRVNMTNGELPVGLQAEDFPQALEDIEFCVTNLRSLPEDLDLKWPQYASIYLEASEFQEVPPSLARLAPYDLSLSLNPISSIPKELFERDSVAYLSFGGTLISELPKDVAVMSRSLYDVNLSDTNVSFFWAWIDPLIMEPSDLAPPITAWNTPYCEEFQRVFEGGQTEFSISPSADIADISILQDASNANWPRLRNGVSCEAEDSTWYPLEFEDEYSRIT